MLNTMDFPVDQFRKHALNDPVKFRFLVACLKDPQLTETALQIHRQSGIDALKDYVRNWRN